MNTKQIEQESKKLEQMVRNNEEMLVLLSRLSPADQKLYAPRVQQSIAESKRLMQPIINNNEASKNICSV
jgi:hypothetical protein